MLINLTKDDFPAPLFPIIPKISFEGIESDTPFTAVTSEMPSADL